MLKIKLVLKKIPIMFCLSFLSISYPVNSQTLNPDDSNGGFYTLMTGVSTRNYQIDSRKSLFAVGLGAKMFQPPSERNSDVGLSYGITAEFQYIRNEVITWYLNLDYYTATYDYGYKPRWVVALIGARIYPEKKRYGLNFNIAGGPLFTDADDWKVMFDLGAGYEIKLGERILLNPYGCMHLYVESGPEGFSILPKPKDSFSLGATFSILL